MANRRKFIAGLGALATGSAAAMGTGAFTNVSAERSVSVNVVGDDSAALRMTTQGTGENSEYVDTSNGVVSVDLSNTDASGVNRNARTGIKDIFRIENQGTQPVMVYVDPESVTPAAVTADPDDDGNPEYKEYGGIYVDPQAQNLPNGDFPGMSFTGVYGQTNAGSPAGGFSGNPYDNEDLTLGVGEWLSFGLVIKTNEPDWDRDISMDLVADAELAGDI